MGRPKSGLQQQQNGKTDPRQKQRLAMSPHSGKDRVPFPLSHAYRERASAAGSPPTHFLRQIVWVKVLQGNCNQALGDVPIDERQTLPCFQVAVRLGLAVFIIFPMTAIRLWGLLELAFSNAPLDVCQRLRGERLETVRAWWCEQPRCHLLILQQLR